MRRRPACPFAETVDVPGPNVLRGLPHVPLTISLANWVTNCPGWGPPGDEKVPDADVAAVATNGREILIAGALHRFDAQGCADVGEPITGIAWRSSDGRNWVRSSPFRGQGSNERADAAWAMPTGWQALTTSGATSESIVWGSDDGLAWRVVSSRPSLPGSLVKAAPDGTILLSHELPSDSLAFELLTSRDGRTWTPVAVPAGCERPGDVTPPSPLGLDRWLLSGESNVCSSTDLKHWSTATVGEQSWVHLTQTACGALAIATHDISGNVPCETEQVSAYLSSDATH